MIDYNFCIIMTLCGSGIAALVGVVFYYFAFYSDNKTKGEKP